MASEILMRENIMRELKSIGLDAPQSNDKTAELEGQNSDLKAVLGNNEPAVIGHEEKSVKSVKSVRSDKSK